MAVSRPASGGCRPGRRRRPDRRPGPASRGPRGPARRPASSTPPPVRTIPAGQHAVAAACISFASSSNVSRIRASMIWQSSSRLTVRPASSPSSATLICSSASTAREVARAVADLELLGDLEARLEPDGDVVGDVVAADRQDARVERRAVDEQREVDRAGADVGDRDAELLLGLGQDGLGGGQRGGDQLVDLDAGLARRTW